ncbi:hypothetical protein OG394_26285 [Kribbella sp. NBC_01245]|uniref:hypothetical protein n=1 Tax=Kribbella sp. NBC_01245 TaxID=2903578 RepID=UPI002E2918CD|nr:hypothetical protein [Kribbella sp. NBC_01245]
MTDSGLPTSEHLEHLDTDTIADLIENLLPANEAHLAREHVKACPDCQQLYDALVELSEDLAEEGRTDIPMPTHVAEHLDAVLVSESVLRASTVGVHSLAQFREQPHRHLPKVLLAAAATVAVLGGGIYVAVKTADQSQEGAAGITDPSTLPTSQPVLSSRELSTTAKKWLEGASAPMIHGTPTEVECARDFAKGQQMTNVELIQPVRYEGTRATMIGLQAASPRDIRVFVITGCDSGTKASGILTETTVTLRNR